MPAPTGHFSSDYHPSLYRLKIEMIPERSHYKNVRTSLPKSEWKRLSDTVAKASGGRCEICGATPSRGLECHEKWRYEESTRKQILTGLQALCKDCHLVKHLGVSYRLGMMDRSVAHMAAVNGISEKEGRWYAERAFKRAAELDRFKWTVDLAWLEKNNGLQKPAPVQSVSI